MPLITRRDGLRLGASALAGGLLLPEEILAQVPTKNVSPPDIQPEKGASLRVMRPTKFVAGDQDLFEANTKKFVDKTGCQVRIDYESWEDLRPKTAVSANIGSGPDVVLGWLDDAHQFPEKCLDLSEVANYIGEKHGGWYDTPARYGRRKDGTWIGMPIGAGGGLINYRKSWVQEAGFEKPPTDPEGFLKLCKALAAKGHPPGLALGNAVGDGNTWHWMMWAFGSSLVDESNRVVVDNPKTVQALEYAKELYQTFIPGTITWLDPNNNKAFLAGEVGLTHNGISIYYVAKNSDDPKVKAIAQDMDHERPFVGPVGRPTETSLIVTAFAFRHCKFPNAAKAYLMHMFDTEQYAAWQTACIGYWQPTMRAFAELPFWTQDPKLTPFREIANNLLWYGYKGDMGYSSAAVLADYVVVQMFANACSGAKSPADAAKDAQRRAERYYKV